MEEHSQAETGGIAPPKSGSRNVFHVIWQRRPLVFLGLALGLTLGLLTYSQRSPVYRATSQVLVVKKQAPNAIPLAGGDPRMAVMDDYLATHLVIIKSPLVIEAAVKRRNLGDLKSLRTNPVGVIQAGLSVARDTTSGGSSSTSGSNVLNLSYSGTDQGDVEVVLAAVVESYKAFLNDTYKNTSEETVTLIKSAVDTLTVSLAKKEGDYRKFRIEHPLLVLGENGVPFHQTKVIEYQKKEADSREMVAAIQKRTEEFEKAVREGQPRAVVLALADQKYDAGPMGTADKSASQLNNAVNLETALFALMQQEAELLQFYGEDHPEVVRVRDRIKRTREFHQRLDEVTLDEGAGVKAADPVDRKRLGLQAELRLATANHKWIKGLLDDELASARSLEKNYDEDRGFRDDIGRTQKVLDSTLKRLEEINLVSGHGGFDAKSISSSRGAKVSPILWQFVLMGSALGIGLGAAVAYLLDLADKSFRTPEEIRRRLGLPIVGHVPFVPLSPKPVGTVDAAGNPIELDAGLLALHDPKSAAAEGIRGVRTALFFNTQAGGQKVIQLTSPNMGDGKTTVITNLAVSIAQSGRKVLLIDADLRRPRIHRAFGLTGKVGLAEVIAGTAELDEAIQVTVVPNLSALPCGRRPQNPAELLTSPRFEDVIDDVRSAFDFILIDSPPLLAVSDPCIVAPRADALLLTLRLFKYGRPTAERARDILHGLKASCIGVVVNGVGKQGLISGYGYEHYRYGGEYANSYYYTAEYSADPDGDEHEEKPPGPAADASLPWAVEPSTNGHSAPPRPEA